MPLTPGLIGHRHLAISGFASFLKRKATDGTKLSDKYPDYCCCEYYRDGKTHIEFATGKASSALALVANMEEKAGTGRTEPIAGVEYTRKRSWHRISGIVYPDDSSQPRTGGNRRASHQTAHRISVFLARVQRFGDLSKMPLY